MKCDRIGVLDINNFTITYFFFFFIGAAAIFFIAIPFFFIAIFNIRPFFFNIDITGYLLFVLNFLTLLTIDLGCATNCLPARLPCAFARLVAARSDALRADHAFSGRYLNLPSEGLPLAVRHFWSVQRSSER
jgi:hypothetical protein